MRETELDRIIKEAGLASKVVVGAGKTALNVGAKAGGVGLSLGKYIVKNPGKAFKQYQIGRKVLGDTTEGVNRAKSVIRPIDYGVNFNYPALNKIAREEQEKVKNKNPYKYLPYAAAATMLALYGAEAYKTKSLTEPAKTIVKGVPNAVNRVVRSNPVGRTVSNTINKGGKISESTRREALKIYTDTQLGGGIPTFSPEEADKAVNWVYENVHKTGKIPKESISPTYLGQMLNRLLTRQEQNPDFNLGTKIKVDKFNKGKIIKEFTDHMTQTSQASHDVLDTIDKIYEWDMAANRDRYDPFFAPKAQSYFSGMKQKLPKIEDINKRVGEGAGFALGAFGMHALGDKYFDARNKEDLSRALEKSRKELLNDASGRVNKHFKDDSKKNQNGKDRRQQSYKRADYIGQAIEKESAMNPKAREILVNDVLKNVQRSLIFATVPAITGQVLNRNLKGNFEKMRDNDKPKISSDRVIIDIPIEQLYGKTASEVTVRFDKNASVWSETKSIAKEVFNPEEVARQAIRALSVTAPMALIAGATGRNIKGNLEKLKKNDLEPLEPGKARIIIETKPRKQYDIISEHQLDSMSGKNASIDSDNFTKEALSVKEIQDKIKKAIVNISSVDEKAKREQRGQKTLLGIELVEGVKKKHRMMPHDKLQG